MKNKSRLAFFIDSINWGGAEKSLIYESYERVCADIQK